ncbi:hypothetical protein PG988_003471 [Apiospora saccharicola]
MSRLKDLPNELYLELLYQCHPRELLTLITASSSIFRVFQRYRPLILNCLTKRLSVVPRPREVETVAYLRLLGNKYKSAKEYEVRCVEILWDLLPEPVAYFNFVTDWPSDLLTLAVWTDICTELDALTEQVRKATWDSMVQRVSTCTPIDNSLPAPAKLGLEETWEVQTGLVSHELYSRLFYHSYHSIHVDQMQCREEFEFRRGKNFLAAMQFAYDIHRNSLRETLSFPGKVFLNSMSLPELLRASSLEKAAFIRYLTSFGIQFAHKISLASPGERREMILSKFGVFAAVTKSIDNSKDGSWTMYNTRICFPQPRSYDYPCYFEQIDWRTPTWSRWSASGHAFHKHRYLWYIGPWFQDWGRGDSPSIEWWEDIHEWENNRWLTREYEEWMRNQNGKQNGKLPW